MVTKTNLYSHKNLEYITIEKFINLIKNGNENTNIINQLRTTYYKSDEYTRLKSKLTTCIMFHGIFSSISNSGLKSLSNYLFFDIDKVDDIQSVKQSLIDCGVNIVWLSPGGNGLHFLVKCSGINEENFNRNQNEVFNYFCSLGFNLDPAAKGLSRKAFLSYDPNIHYGNDKVLFIGNEPFMDGNEPFRGVGNEPLSNGSSSHLKNDEREQRYKGNEPFLELQLIPITELNKQLQYKTSFDKIEKIKIEEIEWVDVLIPKAIPDGQKHKTFRRVMYQLSYLNSNITENQAYSYLYHINKTRTTQKMNDLKLRKLVISTMNHIKQNKIDVKKRIKKIHLNDKLTSEQKEELGGKVNAIIRQNESIDKINEAKKSLEQNGSKITQKEVAKITNLSLSTVKRNWNLEKRDIESIIPDPIDDLQLERDYKLSELVSDEMPEEFFFDEKPVEKEIIKFRNFKEVEIEKVTKEDEKLFIEKVNEIKKIYGEVLENHIIELNLFNDNHKSWYIYDKWRKKYGYKDNGKMEQEIQ